MTIMPAYRRNERGGITCLMIDKANWPPGDWYDAPDKVPPLDAPPKHPVIVEPPQVAAPPQHPGQETHLADSRGATLAPMKRPVGRPPKHPRY